MEKSSEPIVVEETLNASQDIVWEAITDPETMRQWFFETIKEFKPEVGFETCFNVECDGTQYPHRWNVTEVIPGEKLVYRWRYDGYDGDSTVTWELSHESFGTKLKLTHVCHESFPQDNPLFSEDACIDAWGYFITQTLPEYLENNPS